MNMNELPVIGYEFNPKYAPCKATIAEQMLEKFAINSERYRTTAIIITAIMDRKA